jgi:hypothetical protein
MLYCYQRPIANTTLYGVSAAYYQSHLVLLLSAALAALLLLSPLLLLWPLVLLKLPN